jgi:DNA-binding response OmpR family regulator
MRALIVDYSDPMRSFLAARIGRLGFQLSMVESGRAALDHLALTGPVELAFIDCRTAGIELIHAIRNRPEYDTMKLIIVSAVPDLARLGRALEAGADAYLMKPFDNHDLVTKLGTLGFNSNREHANRGEASCAH